VVGALVVLGLGTSTHLILDCWHERVVRQNIQQMENTPMFVWPISVVFHLRNVVAISGQVYGFRV
jgi:hypothetical protein